MRLHELKNTKGAIHRRKRVGTGEGGGRGKTSGRGGKGQTARTGSGIRIGFEGGQMPLYRRLPMRGFKSLFKVHHTAVNVGDFAGLAATVTEINRDVLVQAGILRANAGVYKVLSVGDVDRAFTVHAHGFSAAARAKIEKAGGKCVVIETRPATKPATKPAAPAGDKK